ncbi:hypothetical protein PGQ11_010283 [Apiospora arundinis]|uniref:Chromo domain-containing protein n=1 Tax=Apiospora arundinis TaxID=335852 RepID=A0ABR2IA05_9PEZI
MSQPPHRDNPIGRSAEALPASHPASSNIISPFSAASYKEVPLSNGILKCVIVNGQQTYQLQFTTDKPQGAAYCPQHVSNPEAPVRQHRQIRRSQKLQHSPGMINKVEYDVIGEVDHLIARWRSGRRAEFLLMWTDGTRSWVLRADIDEEMVCEFEAGYDGIYEGGDGWVPKKLISKRLLREHEEQSGKAKDLSSGS